MTRMARVARAGDPFRLDGQTALVTGGGSGLGLAMTEALLAAGARVVITGRRAEPLRDAVTQLGDAASYVQHDVTDLESIPALIRAAESQAGPVDILVNNAGIHLKKPALEVTDAEFLSVLQTHVLGAFALAREAGRGMCERGRGSIIMIGSMAALFGIPQVSAYSAAKSAMVGVMRTLAVEFGPLGVRVNSIAPGWIDTPMSRRAFTGDPARLDKVIGRTPLARLGEAREIGLAVVYLASPAASFVTGTMLTVDGGASIGF